MKLLRQGWTLLCVSIFMQTNSFLCLVRRIPFAAWLLPEGIYQKRRLKLLFSVGGLIKGFFGAAIGRTVLCILCLALIPQWLGVAATPEEMLTLYLLVCCLVPALMSCGIFAAKEADYVFLNHFMMNPKEYYHYKITKDVFLRMLLPLPVLLYLLRDVTLVAAAVLASAFTALAGCVLYLFLYGTLHKMIKKWIRNTVGVAAITASYAALRLGLLSAIKWPLPACIGASLGMAACSVLCYVRLLKYQDYKRIAVEFANKDVVALVVSVNATEVEGASALSKLPWEEGKAYFEENCTLDMEAYVSKAFFRRFRSVFFNQRRQIFLISAFLGVLCGYLLRIGVIPITEDAILNYTPMLLAFAGSTMLFGQRFTELCYRYMDMPFMYHHLCGKDYRKKSLRRRYAFLARHTLVVLSGIALFLLLFLGISGMRVFVRDIVFLLLAMELFSLVNELYYLLVYYFFQPYTADISVKSPMLRVLGVIEGLFDVGVLFLRGNLALACLPLAAIFLAMNLLLLAI